MEKQKIIFLKNYIPTSNILPPSLIDFVYNKKDLYLHFKNYLSQFNIITSIDKDVLLTYSKDWSNIKGQVEMVTMPKDIQECAIILNTCFKNNIPITISAGQTNLTGSATPHGGVVLSICKLVTPKISLNSKLKEVFTPAGIPLEELRKEILKLSNNKFYYPVDPTSRHDAYVGGTLSCNASGFIPGERGATRYWVNEIELLLPNGYLIRAKRGEYISDGGIFNIDIDDKILTLPIPRYQRPEIKNASGPYSDPKGKIDFVDLIIGSEGIYGLITSCKLKVDTKPNDYLELFLCLKNEEKAIDFHDFLYNKFNGNMSIISALEYFGYNSQNYMKHKNFLFKKNTDVGIYIQIPIFTSEIESKSMEWVHLINEFDSDINLDNIIVLNDPYNWKKFFEARHSIPDNALTKTRKDGGISIITDTIVPPKNYRKYLKLIHSRLQLEGIEYLLFGHLGDCHLHFHLIPTKKQSKLCFKIYDYMVDLSSQLGGVYSAEHGTGKRKRNDFKKCYGEVAVEMVRQSKIALDPCCILNRGNIIS